MVFQEMRDMYVEAGGAGYEIGRKLGAKFGTTKPRAIALVCVVIYIFYGIFAVPVAIVRGTPPLNSVNPVYQIHKYLFDTPPALARDAAVIPANSIGHPARLDKLPWAPPMSRTIHGGLPYHISGEARTITFEQADDVGYGLRLPTELKGICIRLSISSGATRIHAVTNSRLAGRVYISFDRAKFIENRQIFHDSSVKLCAPEAPDDIAPITLEPITLILWAT